MATCGGWSGKTGIRDQGSGIREPIARCTLIGECFSLPLELERTLELDREPATAGAWSSDYKLTNTGAIAVPWSWAAHPLFAVEEGDRIVLPESIHSLRLEGSGGGRLGKGGDTVAWPMATRWRTAARGSERCRGTLTRVSATSCLPARSQASENWCALERPSASLRIRVTFDAAATPYLGLWICYGGWPERPGPKQICVALEPATAPVDSLAVTGPWSRVLEPGESFQWTMHVDIRTDLRDERQCMILKFCVLCI